jgi:tetratricopeptide (TPR) repeat protein
MTEFARMRRSDHSMLPPTPAATEAFKSPNACTSCHADKEPSWADRLVREWHPKDYQAPVLRRASLVDAARKRDWTRAGEILGYLREPDRDEIVAASLIRLLGPCEDERKWPSLLIALKDPSPLVRSSAAAGLSGRLTGEAVGALLEATRDGTRLVRIRAAASLSALPPERIPARDRPFFDRAVAELEASFRGRPDDWSSRYNLGNVYLDRGDLPRAAAEYEAAARLRPDTVAPWVNLSMARARLGDPAGAEKSLRRALEIDPRDSAARFNLGLLLAEGGRRAEAEQELRAAVETDPRHAAAAYNLGLLTVGRDPRGGLDLLSRAWSLQPGDPRYGYSLGFHRARAGDARGAMAALRDTLSLHPAHVDTVILMAELLSREGRVAEAALACRRALDAPGLRPPDRLRIERVLQHLNSSP